MNGYKHIFIDTETTGLDPNVHHIWQISGVITTPDLQEIETFDLRFRPLSVEGLSAGAIEKSRMSVEDLCNLPMSAATAYEQLIEILSRHVNRYDKKDKVHLLAYNAAFDTEFLRRFFAAHGDAYYGSWFWHPSVCVMQAAAVFTMRIRGALSSFSLGSLCKAAELGWDEDRAHDGLYDVRKTLELFKYLQNYTPQL